MSSIAQFGVNAVVVGHCTDFLTSAGHQLFHPDPYGYTKNKFKKYRTFPMNKRVCVMQTWCEVWDDRLRRPVLVPITFEHSNFCSAVLDDQKFRVSELSEVLVRLPLTSMIEAKYNCKKNETVVSLFPGYFSKDTIFTHKELPPDSLYWYLRWLVEKLLSGRPGQQFTRWVTEDVATPGQHRRCSGMTLKETVFDEQDEWPHGAPE